MKLDISWRAIAALILGTVLWRLDVIEALALHTPDAAACAVPVTTAELKF